MKNLSPLGAEGWKPPWKEHEHAPAMWLAVWEARGTRSDRRSGCFGRKNMYDSIREMRLSLTTDRNMEEQ